MPHGAEQPLPEPSDDGTRKTRPDLTLVKGGEYPGLPLEEEELNDETLEALARSQELEPPASSPEHHEATPESLINAPDLRAARDKLVSAWADLRKYEHGLIGAARGIVARKSKETARVSYDAAWHAYQQALHEQAQKVEREFGTVEKAKALVYAMEQVTDARAEVVIGKSEVSRKLYQLWQKMGELNVGNVEAVKNILARQEDDSAWKGNAKKVGRFIARGMSLRSAIGAAFVGSGFWVAYAGWRVASGASTGVGVHMLAREGMRVGSRELLTGSEAKVRREYTEEELAGMDDQQLGEIMQAYGARLGFHGEKLSGNTRFERVKNAFLSRLGLVQENVESRIDVGWSDEPRTPEEERILEARMTKRDRMMERLDKLSSGVEDELAKQEKQDRKQRLVAAAIALAAGGAMMYLRGGVSSVAPETPVEEAAPVEMSPKLMRDAWGAPHEEVVKPEALAEAAPAGVELPHGVAGIYEIKSGQGLLHAANEFQKAQHDEIVAGIKTQHPEWFAKGEDYAIRQWRLEQVRDHGGALTAAGEKYRETLHPGAKIRLEFDDTGYPHLTSVEDKHITHHELKYRPRIKLEGLEKWGDNHPIRFSKEGVSGTMMPHGENELGEFTLDVRDVHVDDRTLDRFIDPNFKQALAERFKVGDDPAALAVLEEEARKLGKELAARHAALEYLNEHGEVAPALRSELTRQIDETIQKAHWRFEDAQVFRPVSPAPEEVAQAAAAPAVTESVTSAGSPEAASPGETTQEILQRQVELDPAKVNPDKLVFPSDWTSAQQEAARRVITYHQEIARDLQKLLDSYAASHADDPLMTQLREHLDTAKEAALVHDEQGGGYAVQDILKRIAKGDPGKIPTVELVRGTSTIKDSAWVESEGIFDSWVNIARVAE